MAVTSGKEDSIALIRGESIGEVRELEVPRRMVGGRPLMTRVLDSACKEAIFR